MVAANKERKSRAMIPRLSPEERLLLMAFLAGLPGSSVALLLLWSGGYSPKVVWTLSAIIVVWWLTFAFAIRERVVQSLRTVSNMLMAFREGDFSLRSVRDERDGTFGEVMAEVNTFGDVLRGQRLEAIEATALLRKVMAEIDVAVFAFDGESRLRLANRAGERLLGKPGAQLIGRSASELDLGPCLDQESGTTLDLSFPGGQGRWGIRRGNFRQEGMAHEFLVLADLSRVLSHEEREAWQRLVRVLGHEINNSLTPIKSAAGTLQSIVTREPLPADWRDDAHRVLTVIQSRAEALNRFISAYARLARLPAPSVKSIALGALVLRVVEYETRRKVRVVPGPDVTIQADPDQVEQVLINLTRNAVDAVLETGGDVEITWRPEGERVAVLVRDEGRGIANPANLFVPFFTTKPDGTGIGLVLSRRIAEAHNGSLTLENCEPGGCEARLLLPLEEPR